MNEWQPISTAPKDRAVLLYCFYDRQFMIVQGGWYESPETPGYWAAEPLFDKVSPTHWMELPESPQD